MLRVRPVTDTNNKNKEKGLTMATCETCKSYFKKVDYSSTECAVCEELDNEYFSSVEAGDSEIIQGLVNPTGRTVVRFED